MQNFIRFDEFLYKNVYDQIAAFRGIIPTGRSSPKWIEERKLKVNHIYDAFKAGRQAEMEEMDSNG